jgi:hypothetical protein
MKRQPKAKDRLATVTRLEHLGGGATLVTFEYSTWREERLDANQLAALRRAVGLPAEAGDFKLAGRAVVETVEPGRVRSGRLLPGGPPGERAGQLLGVVETGAADARA